MSDSSSAKSPAETEIPYPDALRLAMQLHRRGDLKAAERLYRILREAMPADPNIIWVTGPSKTADVEGILIEGVHGPGIQIALLVG